MYYSCTFGFMSCLYILTMVEKLPRSFDISLMEPPGKTCSPPRRLLLDVLTLFCTIWLVHSLQVSEEYLYVCCLAIPWLGWVYRECSVKSGTAAWEIVWRLQTEGSNCVSVCEGRGKWSLFTATMDHFKCYGGQWCKKEGSKSPLWKVYQPQGPYST